MCTVAILCTVSCLSSCDDPEDFPRRSSESLKMSARDAALCARDVDPKSSPISELAKFQIYIYIYTHTVKPA